VLVARKLVIFILLPLVLFSSCRTYHKKEVTVISHPREEVNSEKKKEIQPVKPEEKKFRNVCKPLIILDGENILPMRTYLNNNKDKIYLLLLFSEEGQLKKISHQLRELNFPTERIVAAKKLGIKKPRLLLFDKNSCLEKFLQSENLTLLSLKPLKTTKMALKKLLTEKTQGKSPKKKRQKLSVQFSRKETRKEQRISKPKGLCVCKRKLSYLTKDDVRILGKLKKLIHLFGNESYAGSGSIRTCMSFWTERCSLPPNLPDSDAYKEFSPDKFLFSYRLLAVGTEISGYRVYIKPISILKRDWDYTIVNAKPEMIVVRNGKKVFSTKGRLCGCYSNHYIFLIWKASKPYKGIRGASILIPVKSLRFYDAGELLKAKTMGYIYTEKRARRVVFYVYKYKLPKVDWKKIIFGL